MIIFEVMAIEVKKSGDKQTIIKYYGGIINSSSSDGEKSVLAFLQEQAAYYESRIAWYKNQLNECNFLIEAHKAEFNDEDTDTGLVVSDVKEPYNTLKENSSNQSDRQSWKTIAVNIIERFDRLMLSNEIIDESDVILSPQSKKNAKIYLSLGLKELCDAGTLMRYNKPGVKGFYYGLPYMFENSMPKDKFLDNTVR